MLVNGVQLPGLPFIEVEFAFVPLDSTATELFIP